MTYIKNYLRSSAVATGGGWHEVFGKLNFCKTYGFYRLYRVAFVTNY
jgi:hypothetical protein